jgi:hypothetical protein
MAAALLACCGLHLAAQGAKASPWRTANEEELKTVIPARAPVVTEKIETEFRTASAITNGKGKFIAGVVLITAGYSAEGKYSHYFIAQAPIKFETLSLDSGVYVFGWTRDRDSLSISFYEAATGKLLGQVKALRDPALKRVESFRIWPPGERQIVQLGRFTFPYFLGPN